MTYDPAFVVHLYAHGQREWGLTTVLLLIAPQYDGATTATTAHHQQAASLRIMLVRRCLPTS
jgi:hypothetical protein